ncbi:MAG: ABC transporter ATP-binding protein [Lachnospiraceae bacterium]|nr:ABC transporter ATP-binding protein [Lachnospiraceae bacterium]
MKAVEVKGLHAAYDKRDLGGAGEILKGIDFSLEEGKRLAILGSNGSGKTTLVKALCAMIPTSGEIKLLGNPVAGMKRREIASRVSYMTQVSQVFFSYTVFETVLMGRYLHGRAGLSSYTEKDREIARECMRKTGVENLTGRLLSQLSGGELQRVFLARTFAQDTPVLILDEPTNHLDLKVVAGMAEYLKEWCSEPHHTLIGVYHDIPLALSLADELLMMRDGKAVAFGERDELLSGGLLEEVYDFEVREHLRALVKGLS